MTFGTRIKMIVKHMQLMESQWERMKSVGRYPRASDTNVGARSELVSIEVVRRINALVAADDVEMEKTEYTILATSIS